MPDTLTSRRGIKTIAGIYRHLVREGHSIYVATSHQRVVGGVVVVEQQKKSLAFFSLVYRPTSWIATARGLGASDFSRQLLDLVAVKRRTRNLSAHHYIVAVYVDPTSRRSGVARHLLTHAIARARERRVTLTVDTLLANTPAQQLYLDLGFISYAKTALSVIFTLDPE